jgi:hypothetical protein
MMTFWGIDFFGMVSIMILSLVVGRPTTTYYNKEK